MQASWSLATISSAFWFMCIILYIFRFFPSWCVNPHAWTLHLCPRIMVYIYIYIYIYIHIPRLVSAHSYEEEVQCCAERTPVCGWPLIRRIWRGTALRSRQHMRIRGWCPRVWCSGRRLWSLKCVVPVWFVLSVSKRLVFEEKLGSRLTGWSANVGGYRRTFVYFVMCLYW